LLEAPTAFVQRDGEGTPFVDALDGRTGAGLVVGVSDRSEVGVATGHPATGETGSVISAKVSLIPEQLLAPALSIGASRSFGTGLERGSGYVVVSKTLIPYFVRAASGVRGVAVALDAGYGVGVFGHEAFGGAEIVLQDGLAGIAEVVRGRPGLALRYTTGSLSATIGSVGLRHGAAELGYTVTEW
jgi:hypothetical protein